MKAKDYITKGKEYYYRHYDWDKALACFNSALVLEPNNAVAYMNQANVLRILNLHDEALKAIDKAMSFNEKLMDSYFIKSRILSDVYDFSGGTRFYEMGQKLGKGKTDESYYCQAKAAEQLGFKDDALKLLDKAVQYDSTFYSSIRSKIAIFTERGQYKKVIETCEHGLQYACGRIDWWIYKADAYAKLGKPQNAIECYDKAITINPDFTNAIYQKGMFLITLNKLQDALQCFDNILSKTPNYEPAIKEKESILTLLIQKDPQNPVFYDNKADFYLKLYGEAQATEVYLEGLNAFIKTKPAIAQDFGNKILNIQFIYKEKHGEEINFSLKILFPFAEGMERIKDYNQAAKYFSKILVIDNTYISAHIGIINALINQNKYVEATKYIKVNKYMLGEAYDELSYDLTEEIVQDIIFPYLGIEDIEGLLAPHLLGQDVNPLELIEN